MFVMLSVHSLSSIGEDLQRAAQVQQQQQQTQIESKQRTTVAAATSVAANNNSVTTTTTTAAAATVVLVPRNNLPRGGGVGATATKGTSEGAFHIDYYCPSWLLWAKKGRDAAAVVEVDGANQQVKGDQAQRRPSERSASPRGTTFLQRIVGNKERKNKKEKNSKAESRESRRGNSWRTREELNNNPAPTGGQVPPPPVVATILNDLSPVPKVTNQSSHNDQRTGPHGSSLVVGATTTSHMSPPMTLKGWHSKSPDAKAMRYYRLWIYTCNAVLLLAVIVFCGVAGKILLADYKRSLVNGLNLTQPSFVYAYFALLIQSGFIQLIGCFGALRLSEKLLNTYWLLLLLLLIGDALVGVFWMFKFEYILNDLQRSIKFRFNTEYGIVSDFTELWDRLQMEESCCGVLGPHDYSSHMNRSYPAACCSVEAAAAASVVARKPVVFRATHLNSSTGSDLLEPNKTMIGTSGTVQLDKFNMSMDGGGAPLGFNHILKQEVVRNITPLCHNVHQLGCVDRLASWLKSSADILFVLGYCVIAFLKCTFLGILRYEIREMIQKIKLLQTEMANALCSDTEQPTSTTLAHYGHHQPPSATANGILRTDPKIANRDRERNRLTGGSGGGSNCEGEMESLLHHHDSIGSAGGGGCRAANNNNNNNNSSSGGGSILKYNVKQKPLFICPHQAAMTDHHQQQQSYHHHRQDMPMSLPATGTTLYSTCNESIPTVGSGMGTSVDDYTSVLTKTGACGGVGGDYEMNEFDNKSTNYKLLSTPTVTKI